jgi:hypothetical protein
MDIQGVNPKIIKACKAAGIKSVKVRHGRNRGRWGWAVRIGDTLERSGGAYISEELAFYAAYLHYTNKEKAQ